MANKENLVVSVETTTDEALKKRFESINSEIAQIGGVDKSRDEIVLEEGALNGQFANYLLRPENRDAFNKLKADVKKLKGDRENLGFKAGKGLDKLATFLDDITDSERMEKNYNEFMEKIKTPNRLNSIKSWEIRRINLYLGMKEDKALLAYREMKKVYGKYDEYGMKSEDIAFFESVWNTLKNNYKNSDSFIKEDYPAILTLKPTVASLKGLVGENWDGKSESIRIPEAKNSIVDSSIVTNKASEINNKRIDSNREKVKNISISVSEDVLSKFTKSGESLKYQGVDFDEAKMMELFGAQIKEAANQGTEFLNDAERDRMVDVCKGDIFTKLKTDLLSKVKDENSSNEDSFNEKASNGDNEGGEHQSKPENLEYESPLDDIKIKNSALKERIIVLKFCDNLDSGPVKFNINEVKEHLESLKDKERAELEKADRLNRETWTIAVQISLMYLKNRYNKDGYSVKWIDGMRGPETVKGVKCFQEDYGLKFGKNNQPDGLPGKVTIGKIVELLGGEQGGEQGGNQLGDNGGDKGGDNGGDKGGDKGGDNGGDKGGNQGGDKGGDNGGNQGGDKGGDNGGDKGGNQGGDKGGDKGGEGKKSENYNNKKNPAIEEKIGKFNVNMPILDLSDLSSLSANDADQILQGIKNKLNGQNQKLNGQKQRPMLLKLDGLSSLDNKVAEKLSNFEGGITINKILNKIDFDNCASEIAMLKKLAPETNKKIRIIAPSQEICSKLKEKGVTNTEVMPAR